MRGASAPPIPPSSPPQTTGLSNPSFLNQAPQDEGGDGGVSRAAGGSGPVVSKVFKEVRVAEPRRPILWHLAERANLCAPDLRFFSPHKCGS